MNIGLTWEFYVPGLPRPQGSTKSFMIRGGPKAGRIITTSATAGLPLWRNAVVIAAQSAYPNPPLLGPVQLELVFVFPRPKSHYTTPSKRNPDARLRPDAPLLHISPPDLDKLERAVVDALAEAGVYRNDAQVACMASRKIYGGGEAELRVGCRVRILR